MNTRVDTDTSAAAAESPPESRVRAQRRRVVLQLAATTMFVGAVLAGAAAMATSFGSDAGGRGASAGSPLVGAPAPPLPDETLGGGALDGIDSADTVMLVNFWASWCPPCIEEFPVLLDAQRQLGARGLQVVTINSQDRPSSAEAFLDQMGAAAAFPNLVDSGGDLAVEWGVFGLPETFLVDTDGTVVAKAVGTLEPDWIDEHVEPLLDDSP